MEVENIAVSAGAKWDAQLTVFECDQQQRTYKGAMAPERILVWFRL